MIEVDRQDEARKLGVGLRVARLNRVNVDFALAHARAGDLDVTEIYDGIDQRESLLERLAADVVGEKEARLVVKDRFGRWIFLLRSEEHTSELQSLMRISYAVFCLKKK